MAFQKWLKGDFTAFETLVIWKRTLMNPETADKMHKVMEVCEVVPV